MKGRPEGGVYDLMVVVPRIWPLGIGGVERVVRETTKVLSRRGWRVVIAAESVGAKDAYVEMGVAVELCLPSSSTWCSVSPSMKPLRFGIWLLRGALRLGNLVAVYRPRLIHAHYCRETAFLAAIVSRLLRLPLVITFHGSDVTYSAQKWRFFRKMLCFTANRADTLTAVSYELVRELEGIVGVAARKAKVIPNGVAVRVAEDICNRQGRGREPLLVGVGRLSREKGFDVLLRAFASSGLGEAGYRLILIGDGPERFALESLTGSLGLQQFVKFLGYVSHELVFRVLCRATAVVIPSRREGYSLVALEAMAAGCPVIATAVGALPRLLGEGTRGVLVPPDSPGTLAEAIRNVVGQPSVGWRLSRAARSFARARDWGKVVSSYVETYRELTSLTGQ